MRHLPCNMWIWHCKGYGKKEEFVVGDAVQKCLDFESEIVNKSGWRRLSAFVGVRLAAHVSNG